jgi:hypothetical protein
LCTIAIVNDYNKTHHVEATVTKPIRDAEGVLLGEINVDDILARKKNRFWLGKVMKAE